MSLTRIERERERHEERQQQQRLQLARRKLETCQAEREKLRRKRALLDEQLQVAEEREKLAGQVWELEVGEYNRIGRAMNPTTTTTTGGRSIVKREAIMTTTAATQRAVGAAGCWCGGPTNCEPGSGRGRGIKPGG